MPIKDVNSNILQKGSKVIERGFEPLQLSTCKLWVDGGYVYGKRVANPANATVLGTSGSTDIKDLSATGATLNQSSSGSRPTFVSADKSILFDGSNDVVSSGINTLGKNVAILECILYLKCTDLTQPGGFGQRIVYFMPNNSGNARFYVGFPTFASGAYYVGLRYTRTDADTTADIAVPYNNVTDYNFFHFKLNWTTGVGTLRVNNVSTTFTLASTGTTSNTNGSVNMAIGGNGGSVTLAPFKGNLKHLSYYEGSTELTAFQVEKIRAYILSNN